MYLNSHNLITEVIQEGNENFRRRCRRRCRHRRNIIQKDVEKGYLSCANQVFLWYPLTEF